MQFINNSKSKLPFYVALSFTFILASCGSYQYVGYDNDGIYGSEAIVTERPYVTSNNTSYYKNYFAEKSQELGNIPEEDIIFTDIDSYEGDYNEVEDSTSVSGYSGWGQDNENVTINVYPSYGYTSWWYSPFSWNWYRPYYGYYGGSYYGYDPYWYSPFSWYGGYYGSSYYNYSPYWYGHHNNHYYYNDYYGSRNVAYNAGRRGTISNYSSNRTANYTADRTSSLNRRSSSALTRDYSSATRSRSNTLSTTTRRSSNSLTRPSVNSFNRNSNTMVRPRINSNSRPNTTTRSYSTPRRSNNNNSSSINRSSSSSNSSSRSNFSGSSRSSGGGGSPARSSSSSGRRGNQ
jgi:hypothetical protein